MTNNNQSVENCLALLSDNSQLLKSQDKKLICSLANQTFKSIGLTDRQLGLARKKIDEYAELLSDLGVNVELAKERIVIPIRRLDRSRWIRFDHSDSTPKITVRFLFAKKLISAIEQLKKHIAKDQRTYDTETKTWTFDYSESNLFSIVNAFKDYDFDIEPAVLEIYNELSKLDPVSVVPGVYDFQLKNLPDSAVRMIQEEIGDPGRDNLALYKDRSLRYGIHYFDQDELRNSLSNLSELAGKIAARSIPRVHVDTDKYNFNLIIRALQELKRLPVLVLIPSTDFEIVVDLHNSISDVIQSKDTSIMFRPDNTETGAPVNTWIRENQLNNPLDFQKKIVYTFDNVTPKPVLQSDWKPRSVISISHNALLLSSRKTMQYYADQDLIVYYENAKEDFIKYSLIDMEKIQ